MTTLFIRYLHKENVSLYAFENYLSQFQNCNLIFYKEIAELYNECYLFLIKKKFLHIHLFNDFLKYNYLLPEEIQFIIIYTLSLYYYHTYDDLSFIQKLVELFNPKNEQIKSIIDDLSLYYYLKQPHIPSKYRTDYSQLVKAFETQSFDSSLQLNYNEWINASICADLGLFATLHNNHQLAFEYMQKALETHPLIILKYLPAYYTIIQVTQPSLLRFKIYLDKIRGIDELKESICFFSMLLERNKKLKPYIRKVVIPKLMNRPYSIHGHYNLIFFNKILLKKM